MMDFPPSPTEGQTYQAPGGPLYTYRAPAWRSGVTGIPDAPSNGGFYVRSNGVWVPVPRYQKFSVGGGRFLDVTVPTNVTHCRVNGQIIPTVTTPAAYTMVQLNVSTTPGNYLTTTGNYMGDGFLWQASAPNAIAGGVSLATTFGMMCMGWTDHKLIAGQFQGDIMLKRSRTDICYVGNFTSQVFNGANAANRTQYRYYIHPSVVGTNLSVLQLRFINSDAGVLWDTDSYIIVEWF